MASDLKDRTLPPTPSQHQDARKAKTCRGSRCWILMAVLSGLICVLLLGFIILQHFSFTAERDQFKKDTAQGFNHTISILQDTYSDLITENNQLKDRLNYLNEKLKTAYEPGYQWGSSWFFKSNVSYTWLQSRQFCLDRGADLVIINSEVKQTFLTSVITAGGSSVWIGLTDAQQEGTMKWVDNSLLKQGFFRVGQPDDYLNEDCVELPSSSSSINNWNDLSCVDTRRALCEK